MGNPSFVGFLFQTSSGPSYPEDSVSKSWKDGGCIETGKLGRSCWGTDGLGIGPCWNVFPVAAKHCVLIYLAKGKVLIMSEQTSEVAFCPFHRHRCGSPERTTSANGLLPVPLPTSGRALSK